MNLNGEWAVVRSHNHNSVLDTTDDKTEALDWAKEMNQIAGRPEWNVIKTIGKEPPRVTNGEAFGKAIRLRNEYILTSRRVAQCVYRGTDPDPEDIVLLRGNTEALIQLAEEACKDS